MFEIYNYYEQLVITQLKQLAKDSDEPLPHGFLEDVACLALNDLPTCYVRHIADKVASLTEEDRENMRTATEKAIKRAMVHVRLRPHTEG